MDTISNYILCINQYKNISRAAKALNISQPALSSALFSREKKLGYQIFNRKTTPLSLTSEGHAYISHLYQINILEHKLESKIQAIQNKTVDSLSIGAPSAYINTYILPVLPEFIQDYPDCRIKIIEGTISHLVQLSQEGKLDFFISTTFNIPADFHLDLIGKEHIYLCVPKNIIINDSNLNTILDSVLDKNFIFLEDSQPLQLQINRFFQKRSMSVKSGIQVDQTDSAVNLAAHGYGVCFASGNTLEINPYRDYLNTYILPDEDFPRNLYLASLTEIYLTEIYKSFFLLLTKTGGTTHETSP